MDESITSKMISWNAWNHKRRTLVLLPLCYLIGYLGGVHLVGSAVPDEIVGIFFGVAAILIGGLALAVID